MQTHTHTHTCIHKQHILQEHMFTQTQMHMSTVTAQTGTCRQTHFKHTLTQHKHTNIQIYMYRMHAHQAYLKHGLITITSHTLLNSRYHTNAHSTVIQQIPSQFTWSYPVYYCVPSLPWRPALTSIAQPTVIVPQDHLLLASLGGKLHHQNATEEDKIRSAVIIRTESCLSTEKCSSPFFVHDWYETLTQCLFSSFRNVDYSMQNVFRNVVFPLFTVDMKSN